jgi:hypothetical protein
MHAAEFTPVRIVALRTRTTTDVASAVAAPIACKLAVLTKRQIVLNMGMGKYLCGIIIPHTSANR